MRKPENSMVMDFGMNLILEIKTILKLIHGQDRLLLN